MQCDRDAHAPAVNLRAERAFRAFPRVWLWCAFCIRAAHATRRNAMNATIDETIDRVEQLYRALTGSRPPTGRHTVIPPEADPVGHVQEQLGRMVTLVERFVPGAPPQWMPQAMVWTHDSDLLFAVDIPGVLASDIEVRVEPAAITVRGLRRPPWAHPPKSVAFSDVALGTFARSFPLAVRIAPDHVSARLDDGVLTVRLHASTRAEPSQIPICS